MQTNTPWKLSLENETLTLKFYGVFDLYRISALEQELLPLLQNIKQCTLDLKELQLLDTAGALFLTKFASELEEKGVQVFWDINSQTIQETLALTAKHHKLSNSFAKEKRLSPFAALGKMVIEYYAGFIEFLSFLGLLFYAKFSLLFSWKNIRYKEILFEIYQGALKAFLIVSITSFLIGIVVAYQSAYQLKLYGANIFIVDMLGLSILRELSPLITAIIIAGRSGSAYTAQIGAMKITEELDAMRTMGFDPYLFLVLPRMIALMLMMPLLIFLSDILALLGGIFIANLYLDISPALFIERFSNAIDLKHLAVGIVKGPFFAFLIAAIAIHRGLKVKNDTQSIGLNTTKSVVESIFAVIVCDAVFSVFFTNLGI